MNPLYMEQDGMQVYAIRPLIESEACMYGHEGWLCLGSYDGDGWMVWQRDNGGHTRSSRSYCMNDAQLNYQQAYDDFFKVDGI
jgi:hypothetical protein